MTDLNVDSITKEIIANQEIEIARLRSALAAYREAMHATVRVIDEAATNLRKAQPTGYFIN